MENNLWGGYSDWGKKRDVGLAQYIAKGMKWTYDTLKTGDPDGYVMPTMAWWTTYDGLASLYDVNVPNEYPCRTKDEPLTGALYHVVYDAAKAADAASLPGGEHLSYTCPASTT